MRALAGLGLIVVLKPRLLLRVPLWLLCHSVYRVRTVGRLNVPAPGPALLVCNHVTHLDWLFLAVS